MAEYRYLAKPDPEWIDFPNSLPRGTKVHSMTRDRQPIAPQDGLDISKLDVAARDAHPVRLRSYRQTRAASAKLPLLLYIHGGGYVTGGLETDDEA